MSRRVIPLHLTERARRAQLMVHATPGVVLIATGIEGLISGESHLPWLDVLGILAGLFLIIMLRLELRPKAKTHHSTVHWYEVIAGCVIILEGAHKLHKPTWFQPGTLLMLVGVMVILLGVFHTRIEAMRRLVLDDDGFLLQTRVFRKLSMKWSELATVKLSGTDLISTDTSKRTHTIGLRNIENRGEVFDVIRGFLPSKVLEKHEGATS